MSYNNDHMDDARANEISTFAAFARGDAALTTAEGLATSTTDDGSSTMDIVRKESIDQSFSNVSDSSFFIDTGTFLHRSSNNKNSTAETSNLEAAAQAFEGRTSPDSGTAERILFEEQHAQRRMEQQRSGTSQTPSSTSDSLDCPMFMEQVVMERPLFFGAVLPPRIIAEGRKMVAPYRNQPLTEMPPSVRNLVGAINVYGFGLHKLLFLSDDEFEKYCNENPEYWRGDSTVSTYSPVVDETTRAERMKDIRKRSRQSYCGRASTAPSGILEQEIMTTESSLSVSSSPTSSTRITPATSLSRLNTLAQQGQADSNMEQELDTSAETTRTPLVSSANDQQFSSWLEANKNDDGGELSTLSNVPTVGKDKQRSSALREMELFARWANGSVSEDPTVLEGSSEASTNVSYNTFQRIPTRGYNDDNDSVVDDELKKKVGLNDHLSKAIASLTESEVAGGPNLTSQEESRILTQGPVNSLKKRPLSNYELTRGCVPLFGVDDSPIPVEGDLGVHETREDQDRSNEQKRSQDFIEKCVAPNIFGSIACPNPAVGPDDFHSWKSRALSPDYGLSSVAETDPAVQAYYQRMGQLLPMDNAPSDDKQSSSEKHLSPKRKGTKHRFGWWNIYEDKPKVGHWDASETDGFSLQRAPLHHASSSILVATLLDPSPQELRDDNLPLTNLHAATPMAQTLPYLSDRPPSYRYLQIDTQAVGFPSLDGEIEPLFCSLAIYNVESFSDGTGDRLSAPLPDLQRCGRVTEALNFDLVSDSEVARRCHAALWPYAGSDLLLDENYEAQLQGSRCGVFPIPSSLDVSNLYAVLVVKKVVSNETDLEPYLRTGSDPDIEQCRSQAEKAATRNAHFLFPFAFGVAPLHQVFGANNPIVASSRAVQIPLFHFNGGEKSIIDHIMVMLFPRSDHRASGISGPASLTNGGTAMLVMRNFGFLGLHGVVDKKSSLARDRLVDFTGELQIRRKTQDEMESDHCELNTTDPQDTCKLTTPQWHSSFVSEPAAAGGRNDDQVDFSGVSLSRSRVYAQELAPVPLQLNSSMRLQATASIQLSGVPRHRLHGNDAEPVAYSTFCNELLFHPRLVHNCSEKNIVVKAELREMHWSNELMAFVANVPRHGPSIHNTRRGPFLVQSVFTSCSVGVGDHHFLDEFKIKLPLDLNPKSQNGEPEDFVLVFEVYKIQVDSGQMEKETRNLQLDASSKVKEPPGLAQIACGFLSLSNNSCLLENGLHDVRMGFLARSPSPEMCNKGYYDSSSLILVEAGKYRGRSDDEDYREEEMESMVFVEGERQDSMSIQDGKPTRVDGRDQSEDGLAYSMSLSVKVVAHSSVHSQNNTLQSLLQQEAGTDFGLKHDNVFISTLKMGPEFFLSSVIPVSPRSNEGGLLELCADATRQSVCGIPQTASYLWRIFPLLMKMCVWGSGKPDLAWANPSASTELRVNAFASILRLLGSATMYFSKNGVCELDGTTSLSVVTLGRVMALLFDEERLFGVQALEHFDENMWMSQGLEENQQTGAGSISPTGACKKKRGHIRQTYDLSNDVRHRDVSGSVDFSILKGSAFSSNVAGFETEHEALSDGLAPSKPESINMRAKTTGDSFEPEQRSTSQVPLHVDSKSDFQSLLRAAVASEIDADGFDKVGASSGEAAFRPKGLIPQGSRRWMTMPTRALSTIRETEAVLHEDNLVRGELAQFAEHEAVRKEQQGVNLPRPSVMQMRVPSVGKKDKNFQSTVVNKDATAANDSSTIETKFVPISDKEIENAGSEFLDSITKIIGARPSKQNNVDGEDRRVGLSNHRKSSSHGTSIDWSVTSEVQTSIISCDEDGDARTFEIMDSSVMSTMLKEETGCMRLPNFAERLMFVAQNPRAHDARWYPYAYEVIIMQWCAILIAQRQAVEPLTTMKCEKIDGQDLDEFAESAALKEAAVRSSGVSIASAPMLFEIIKHSIGFRVLGLFREAQASICCDRTHPPLVALDETLLLNLEHVISMVTDACLDARNFDSWELRKMSIDVNDSIIHFLRDMFSFLAPAGVHHLILVYLSRYVTREGKQWQDRDSNIGLRPSWEVARLRLHAVTALVRFPDFVRVNGPQIDSWHRWTTCPTSPQLFDTILEQYGRRRLSNLVGGEEIGRKSRIDIPGSMKPHWLSELILDICLLGVSHTEPQIRHRSSSLIYELFWMCSQNGMLNDKVASLAAMFVTFIEKILPNLAYLSSFSPSSQLRLDLIPCAIFVLQSAPTGLLRALWRRLLIRLPGRGSDSKYGFTSFVPDVLDNSNHSEDENENSILDIFCLLNLSLKTLEYSGDEDDLDPDSVETRDSILLWRRDFLLCHSTANDFDGRHRAKSSSSQRVYTTSVSRRWMSHDAAIVILNTSHNIVLEMFAYLGSSEEGRTFLNPAARNQSTSDDVATFEALFGGSVKLNYVDVLVFVRGATSVYLQALALRESDIALVRTLKVSAETIKIFGIRMFLEAVGETLQHWMRVILFLCGARRAVVRVEATDLLELILRSSWEYYGSFFRIRVPLLAVQTEVMERIVASAASRFYREQRKNGTTCETFSNLSAEASLVPLWRTLDRLEQQPASQNIAFRGALIRIAAKLKTLYRAYVAARVLSFIQGSRQDDIDQYENAPKDRDSESLIRARRISLLRVINASDNYSKQFLGMQGTSHGGRSLAHYEAVEDAMINAADVFSSTELPEHRVAWLRMLADFHATRRKFAEEATCHFQIYRTLQHAARLHGSLWSNTPFLLWTDNMPDPVYIDGDREIPNGDIESELEYDSSEDNFGRRVEHVSSFRRIFYRVANSISTGLGDCDNGATRNLFYGATSMSEYNIVSPWITLGEMEENMVEEAEAAGELFLQAGIIQSSRYSWNVATDYYAEKFNYTKLALAYGNLAATVVTSMPTLDANVPQEISATLGRFYRVWFHGGAPDELSGVEFIYRTEASIRLDQFGDHLRDVIKSIIPDKTPIHLLLDGRVEDKVDDASVTFGFSRIGPAPLEPVRIKVTPLRPLSEASGTGTRGRPEWFRRYSEEYLTGRIHRIGSDFQCTSARPFFRRSASYMDSSDPQHRDHARSFSATMFSSGNNNLGSYAKHRQLYIGDSDKVKRTDGELSGVDKFCFVQTKDRKSSARAWWKTSSDIAEKTLKVTQLQVAQAFPACVTRQVVVHRLVYSQSPLEAGVDAICQWCAVLFRTAVATSGQVVVNQSNEPGIGTDAAKVVADCIHSSNVKEIGLSLLKKNTDISDGDTTEFSLEYDRLTDEEIRKLQLTVASLIIVFIELLHLLIARNRDRLLDVIQVRKKGEPSESQYKEESIGGRSSSRSQSGGKIPVEHRRDTSDPSPGSSYSFNPPRSTVGSIDGRSLPNFPTPATQDFKFRVRTTSESTANARIDIKRSRNGGDGSVGTTKADSAIAVQSELQRAFITLCKLLLPQINNIMMEKTPRWLRSCTLDNYFSSGTYKQTKLPMAEELCFNSDERMQAPAPGFVLGSPEDVEASTCGSVVDGSASNSVLSKGSYSR